MIALVVFVAAILIVSAGMTRYLSSSRTAVAILDEPNERSLHENATPRTGGLAILLSLAAGLAAAYAAARAGWVDGVLAAGAVQLTSHDFVAVGIATTFLAGMSLVDDIRNVSPLVRFAVQVLAAAGLVWGADFTIASFWVPGYGPLALGLAAYPITLLFIVWMANLYNFMDGMDGLAGGMAVVGFGVMGALAIVNGGPGIGVVAIAVAAAAAGFLYFNYPPARIFMGDVGAVPLGFLVASLAVKANRELVLGLWVPLILFSPFIADATVVVVRRALRGERIWEAHREHYYQRLVLAGWSHRKTLWAEYAAMACCAGIGVFYKQGIERGRFVLTTLVGLAYLALAFGVRAVERRAAERQNSLPRLRRVR